MRFIVQLIGTGLYTGYAPIAPGTAGSLLGLLLYWLIPQSDSVFLSPFIILLLFVGVWVADRIEKDTGVTDNGIIVIDEIVGMLITVFLIKKTIFALVTGFFLFRFFDIIKLFPAHETEKLSNGWGVMLDDVVAGIYSALSLRLIIYFTN